MPEEQRTFEQLVLPHLKAGYNLARWILRNDRDAEDVMQEATLRAFRFLDGFSGSSPRAWLLSIVRNAAHSFLQQDRGRTLGTAFDEDRHAATASAEQPPETPEASLERKDRQRALNDAVLALPVEFREVFVLRELEGFSYKEIAGIAAIPIGTVMSRLSRARRQLQAAMGAGGAP